MQIDHILYTVTLELVKSERQSFQFENLRYYYIRRYSPNLSPYPLNSLQNYIFKKSHLRRQLIPKKFHQIWIGNHSISPIRIALAKTLTDNNPDYEYFLWRD